jgi:hypothetical protein
MGFKREHAPFGQVKGGQPLWGVGQSPAVIKRSARVNPENNPVNCFRERDALQERASLNGRIISAPTFGHYKINLALLRKKTDFQKI